MAYSTEGNVYFPVFCDRLQLHIQYCQISRRTFSMLY